MSYGVLAPGASQTLTFTVTKNSPAVGTNNRTNTFTVSDTSITDTNVANNTLTHVVSVYGSPHTICNNSALTVPINECEILSDFYTFST